jgi:hypothetical protein
MTTQNIYPETKRRDIGLLPFIVAIVVPLLSAPLAGVQSEGELQETNGIFGFPIYPESWGEGRPWLVAIALGIAAGLIAYGALPARRSPR